ncbi:MAG: lipid IV(A) 3-deoxy-D-manno-octulosonic acid transferase [Ectothiorhodospiraceae bacterium]|nr:lipid IV(A) 3-deoxy-D-manno-octulosonic acid transferase [Chromatiales bacterium]MCP5156993.1 lipid IV(A) 3-deoxy-D-manno-octulosonic acid transferase [Ectothiorhodospiraceae bacterium]
MPVVMARLAWRGIANPGYRRHLLERFGYFRRRLGAPATVWVHAVSVGEVQAAVPLVRALRERHPREPLVVTTMTPTGRERALGAFGDDVVVAFLPYDLPRWQARFLRRVRPRVAVVMETELWPNLAHACERLGVPMVLVNQRMSERSARGYRLIAPLARAVLRRAHAVAAQASADAERLVALGAPAARTLVTGSLKFEARPSASVGEAAQALRRVLGVDRSVWIAASTHDGEESQVLEAHRLLRAERPDALLVLVPRHPERFDAVATLARQRGFRVARRTESPTSCEGVDVFVGDTMGELPVLYRASDVAFVGGSLVGVGGHNPLEPAALGLPILSGPVVFNFAEIFDRLRAEELVHIVDDAPALGREVGRLLGDANLRHGLGEGARRFVEANRGALDRVLALVEQALRR